MVQDFNEVKLKDAECAEKTGRYDIAEQLIGEVLASVCPEESPSILGHATRILGNIAYGRSEYQIALSYYRDSLAYSETAVHILHKAKALASIANTYKMLCDNLNALQYYTEALSIFEVTKDKLGIASTYCNIGGMYHGLSDYPNTLKFSYKAIEIANEIDNKFVQATSCLNIGIAYRELSEYNLAIEYLTQAQSIYLDTGNLKGQANSVGCIGLTFLSMYDFNRALDYYNKALTLCKQINDEEGIATWYGNIGISYYEQEDYVLANVYFNSALQAATKTEIKSGMIKNLGNIGNVHFTLGSYHKALMFYNKAIELSQHISDKRSHAINLFNVAMIYSKPDYRDCSCSTAIEYSLDAIAILEELSVKRELYDVHKGVAQIFKSQHRWEEYSEHIEKYHELYIKIQNEEVKKQADRFGWERKILEMEKQKEIDRLKAEKEKLEAHRQYELKANEVEVMIHELVRKNSFLHEVSKDVKQLAKNATGNNIETAEHLLNRLERNIVPLESKAELEQQWHEVHAKFMEKLSTKFPSMSPMEIKICALLKMRLTSSNISTILFLSRRTVEFHRLNIRKKMGLTKTDDLHIILNTIV